MHAYMHEKGWQYQYLYLWLGSLQIYLLPDHSFCGPRTDLSTKLFFLDKGIYALRQHQIPARVRRHWQAR
jgi:hypothetical protein